MNNSINLKPQRSIQSDINTFINTLTSDVKLQEYSNIKFVNSTPLNNVFQTRTEYVDYKIPSRFNSISKTETLCIEAELEVSKTFTTPSLTETLYLSTGPSFPPINSISTTQFPVAATRSIQLPINSITGNNGTYSVYRDQPSTVNNRVLEGTYTFSNIVVESDDPVNNNTQFRLQLQKYNTVTGSFTSILNSPFQSIPSPSIPTTLAPIALVVPQTILESSEVLAVLYEFQNNTANPAVTNITTTFNIGVNAPTLVRDLVVETAYIQNMPTFTYIDHIDILLNGSLVEQIDRTNYFCEMSLWDRERLRLNAQNMLYDEENYGISFKFPASIILASNTPETKTESFRIQLPLYSTFLQSKNFLWPLINDQITIRVYWLPYSSFRISSVVNQATNIIMKSTSLNMGGPKFHNIVTMALKNSLAGSELHSPCYLRKYGFNSLLPQQDNTLNLSPMNGQVFFDLSYLNGKFLALWSFIYPENTIGGENFLQYVLNYNEANVSNNLIPSFTTALRPIRLSTFASKDFRENKSFLYTPDSAFALDRINILTQEGYSVFENLNIAEYFRNIMSQTGNSSDFLKTYALYPFYFSSKVIEDYKYGCPQNGLHEIEDIYNIDIILKNPNACKLPIYDNSNNIVKVMYNRLYVNGLMASTCIINQKGSIYFEGL
jgi:hypothetical protein